MSRFRVTMGPLKGLPGGAQSVGIPAFGGRIAAVKAARAKVQGARALPTRSYKSKKAYTGTLAGIGRTPKGQPLRQGPAGPAGARFQSTQLPSRASTRAALGGSTPSAPTRRGILPSLVRRARAAMFGV